MATDTRLVAALRDFASSEAGAITDDYLASEVEVTRLQRELDEAKARRDGYAATWQRFWQHWNGPTEHLQERRESPGYFESVEAYEDWDERKGRYDAMQASDPEAPAWGGIEQYQAESR